LGVLEYRAAYAGRTPFSRVVPVHEPLLVTEMLFNPNTDIAALALSVAKQELSVRTNESNCNMSIRMSSRSGINMFEIPVEGAALGRPLLMAFSDAIAIYGGGFLSAVYGTEVDKRGIIELKLTAKKQEQFIGEPCAFALKMAKAIAKSYEKHWNQEFFERAHAVLVEHLGASDRIDHRGQFTCNQPTGETLIPGGRPGGWMRFYIDEHPQRFRVNCEPERRTDHEQAILATNEALKPLAAEYFARRK